MKSTQELEQMIRSSEDPSVLDHSDFSAPELSDYLHTLLRKHGMTVIQAIQRCNLERSYGYQLFNGTRRPTRNILLTLAIHLGLTDTETQRLLKMARRPVLYARNRQDAAILYCLSHHLPPEQAAEFLTKLGVTLLDRDI